MSVALGDVVRKRGELLTAITKRARRCGIDRGSVRGSCANGGCSFVEID
jgi:hypothetical protein